MNNYAIQIDIPMEYISHKDGYMDYVQHRIEYMKREGAIKIFDEIYSCGHPVVVQTHLEEWRENFSMRYRLHYQLTAVQSMHVTVPVLTYVNYQGESEWKCSACGIINKMTATYCGEAHKHAVGCGRPRDFVQ